MGLLDLPEGVQRRAPVYKWGSFGGGRVRYVLASVCNLLMHLSATHYCNLRAPLAGAKFASTIFLVTLARADAGAILLLAPKWQA